MKKQIRKKWKQVIVTCIICSFIIISLAGCSESLSPSAKLVGPPTIRAMTNQQSMPISSLDWWKLDGDGYAEDCSFGWHILYKYVGGEDCEEPGILPIIKGENGDGVWKEENATNENGESLIWVGLTNPGRGALYNLSDMKLTTDGSNHNPLPFWCLFRQFENYTFWQVTPHSNGLYYGLAHGSAQSLGSQNVPFTPQKAGVIQMVKTARPKTNELNGLENLINVKECSSGIRMKWPKWCKVKSGFEGWTAIETDTMVALPTSDRQRLASISNPYVVLIQFDTAEEVKIEHVKTSAIVNEDPNHLFDITFHKIEREGLGVVFVSDYIVPIEDPNNTITTHLVDNVVHIGVGLAEGQHIRLNPPNTSVLLPEYVDAHLTDNKNFDINEDGIVNFKDYGILLNDPNNITKNN